MVCFFSLVLTCSMFFFKVTVSKQDHMRDARIIRLLTLANVAVSWVDRVQF